METRNPAQNVAASGNTSELVTGQRLAFAAASLVVGLSAFVSLLGMEKAILAIVFGALALRNGATRSIGRLRLARFGIGLGILQIALIAVLFAVFHDQVMAFFEHLERFQIER